MPAAGALSYEELELIKKVLGDKCSPLLSTVARLLMAPPDGSGWRNTKMAGAVVLGVNREKNGAKFIRLYDMKLKEILFEQELYVGMVYSNPVPYFHVFEVDGAIIGLDFAVESEADNFHSKVNAMIPTSSGDSGSAAFSETSRKTGFMEMLGITTRAPRDSVISRPTNVQHLQHIGYDPEKGFEVSNIPPEWKALFKSAGLKPKDLKNAETAAAIVATLENYEQEVGGGSAFSSPPPAPAPPAPPSRGGGAPPPPAPPKPGGAPPPPARGAPAAPPAPSAPPAPPAPSAPKAPPAPSAPKGPPAAPKPGPPAPAGGGGRDDLLAAIRKGKALKKVADEEGGDASPASPGRPGLAKKPSVGPRGGPGPAAGGGGDLADRLRAVMDARRLNIKHEEAEADGDDDW